MTRGRSRTIAVPRAQASVYLRRGQSLMQMIRAAESTNNIDGIAINGVLAAVALSDALTIAKLGLRSKGQYHQEVVTLISRIGTERSAKIASLVQRVIDRKQDVEYGDRQVGAEDAQRIAGLVREIADLVVAETG